MKKATALLLSGMLAAAFLAGCGEKEAEQEVHDYVSNLEETLEKEEPKVEESQKADVPNWNEITKSELLSLSAEEVMVMVEEYIPDYKERYRIERDVMTESDWLSLRGILSIEKFGSDYTENDSEEETDPYAIYYAPTPEYIRGLSDEGFVNYLAGLQEYMYPDTEPIDWSALPAEDIASLREEYADEIESN